MFLCPECWIFKARIDISMKFLLEEEEERQKYKAIKFNENLMPNTGQNTNYNLLLIYLAHMPVVG